MGDTNCLHERISAFILSLKEMYLVFDTSLLILYQILELSDKYFWNYCISNIGGTRCRLEYPLVVHLVIGTKL